MPRCAWLGGARKDEKFKVEERGGSGIAYSQGISRQRTRADGHARCPPAEAPNPKFQILFSFFATQVQGYVDFADFLSRESTRAYFAMGMEYAA